MKQTSKRLQALVLVLAMCVSFLQIPSFAAHKHEYTPVAQSVNVDKDGNLTIVKRCEEHKNQVGAECTVTVTGKIEKQQDGKYLAVDADKKPLQNVDVAINDAKTKDATCVKAGTIAYIITVDNVDWDSGVFETEPATGKHDYAKDPTETNPNALYAELIANTKEFELVSDTATCDNKGDAVFAKKCKVCGAKDETATVVVKNHSFNHEFVIDKDGKNVESEEVLQAATCKEAGKKLVYLTCQHCSQKWYYTSKDKSTFSTSRASAYEFTIDKLTHNYLYKAVFTGKYVSSASVNNKTLPISVEVTCADCDYKGTNVNVNELSYKLVTEKTVKPEKACQPGSAVYEVTYKVAAPTEKDPKATKEIKEEVTVPYYMNSKEEDNAHVWSENTTTDMETYKAPTCTEAGHMDQIYVCTVCGEKKIAHTVTTPATGKHTAAAAKKENVVAATTKKGGSYDLVVRCADCGKVLSKTHKTTAKIVVKASKVTKATNVKGKKAKITVKKAASVTGYQIQYGTKKNFKGAKSVKTKATTKTVSKLAKKKYYVRVRTYKVVDGKTYYSSWSGAKTVTIKK